MKIISNEESLSGFPPTPGKFLYDKKKNENSTFGDERSNFSQVTSMSLSSSSQSSKNLSERKGVTNDINNDQMDSNNSKMVIYPFFWEKNMVNV